MAVKAVWRATGLGALTAAGQVVVLGSLPAYSRIFDPRAYGEYLIFVGTVAVVAVFAGFRYDSAIVLPRSVMMASALSDLVMLIALAVAALIAAATFLAQELVGVAGGWLRFRPDFGYALAAATVIGALQRCLSSWCVRRSRFITMGFGQFMLALTTVAAQLWFSRWMNPQPALLWGYVCAMGFQVACLACPMLSSHRLEWVCPAPPRAMGIAARKYRRFPTYMVGYALASSSRDRLVQIALGMGAGASAVGRFGLAYRVTFAPNSLLYSAISPVFFGLASRGDRHTVGRFAAALVEALYVILLVPYVAFALEAPRVTDGLLSDKWHGTGPYLQALAGPALMLAATCWLDRAFDCFRRQNVAFGLEASFTVAAVVIVAGLSRCIDPVRVAWAFGALAIVYYWIYFLLTFTACQFPMTELWRACRTGAIATITALALGGLAHQFTALILRLLAYALLTLVLILCWIKFGGGAAAIRLLLQLRVDSRDINE